MALVSVLIFDETFSSNLFQAVGEPIAIMPPWELEVAGMLDVLNARCVMLRLSLPNLASSISAARSSLHLQCGLCSPHLDRGHPSDRVEFVTSRDRSCRRKQAAWAAYASRWIFRTESG